MTRQIGVAVIGRGFGMAVHVPAFALLGPQGVEVVHIAGRHDWRQAVIDPRVDLVSIATPPESHAQIALAALGAGKAVLCEKPLATTIEDAEAMVAAAEEAGIPTAVNFSYRALPAFALARVRIRRDRSLGAVKRFAVRWQVDSRHRAMPDPSWKDDARAGGGALATYGVHTLDYVEWLIAPILRVEASLNIRERHGAESDDALAARVELVGGATGEVEITTVAQSRLHRVEVHGEGGTLVLENSDPRDHVRAFSVLERGRPLPLEQPRWRVAAEEDGRIEPFASHADGLVAAIRRDEPFEPSFREGLRAQWLIDTIRRSSS